MSINKRRLARPLTSLRLSVTFSSNAKHGSPSDGRHQLLDPGPHLKRALDVVTLESLSPLLAQEGKLGFIFHAFSHHLEMQVTRHRQDGFHQGDVVGVMWNVLHETLVDLEFG